MAAHAANPVICSASAASSFHAANLPIAQPVSNQAQPLQHVSETLWLTPSSCRAIQHESHGSSFRTAENNASGIARLKIASRDSAWNGSAFPRSDYQINLRVKISKNTRKEVDLSDHLLVARRINRKRKPGCSGLTCKNSANRPDNDGADAYFSEPESPTSEWEYSNSWNQWPMAGSAQDSFGSEIEEDNIIGEMQLLVVPPYSYQEATSFAEGIAASVKASEVRRARMPELDLKPAQTEQRHTASVKQAGSKDAVKSLAKQQLIPLLTRPALDPLTESQPGPQSENLVGGGRGVPSEDKISRVAYQGMPGAYSEAAAAVACTGCQFEGIPCETFDDVFRTVESGLADQAIVPIENSLGGCIHRNYDLLLRHRLHVVGEVQLPINHCLLAMPGVKPWEIRKVLSHPQALAQCEGSMAALGISTEVAADTAGSARFVSQAGLKDTAAIASRRAAEIYGLDVVAEGIQDEVDNVTRFLVLSRKNLPPPVGVPCKTSLAFALHDGASALLKALFSFSLGGFTVCKVEARPHKGRPLRAAQAKDHRTSSVPCGSLMFDYVFYVDVQAHVQDKVMESAIRHLKTLGPFVRVLGSYKMDLTPPPSCSQ